jgi:hypothetical protein
MSRRTSVAWLVGLVALLVAATVVSSAFGGRSEQRVVWPYGLDQIYTGACAKLPDGGASCACQAAILRTRVAWGDLSAVYAGTDVQAAQRASAAATQRCGGPDPQDVMRAVSRG